MPIQVPSIFLQLGGSVLPAGGLFTQGIPLNDKGNPSITVQPSAGGVNGIYAATRTVTAGTPDVINLTSLVDLFGNAITVGHLVAVHLQNPSGTATGVTLTAGGGSEAVFPAGRPIGPGGDDVWQDVANGGIAVTAGTAQNLQVVASSGSVTYTIVLFTRSA